MFSVRNEESTVLTEISNGIKIMYNIMIPSDSGSRGGRSGELIKTMDDLFSKEMEKSKIRWYETEREK